MASLAISLSFPTLRTLHHAITIWGYEIDNTTGLITKLLGLPIPTISKTRTTPPRIPVQLHRQGNISSYQAVRMVPATPSLYPVSGYKSELLYPVHPEPKQGPFALCVKELCATDSKRCKAVIFI